MSEINFYNVDCVEFMKTKPDNYYDLAIVDPPYGLGKRLSSGGGKMKDSVFRNLYEDSDQWDILPDKEYWEQLFRISKNQIVFGANYFLEHLPNTRGFVCWDKQQDMPTLSACELVWTSFDKPAKIYKKSSTDLNRFHPTQKPIDLYRYMITKYAPKGHKRIIDTHGGSMNSAIACDMEDFDLDICEISSDYFKKGVDNYKLYKRQQVLF